MQLVLPTPYPKQVEFFKADSKYVAYGGSRGGGKSFAARIKAVLLAMAYPGIQILLLRRNLKDLRANHTIPLCSLLKTEEKDENRRFALYKDQTKEFIFPNKSRITLGYCDTEKDVLQFQGQSYDVVIMEEATQFTEFQFQCLTECNRSSGMCVGFSPRMYFTCNPGGVGHQWFKRIFIDKDYKDTENPADYTFIPSTVYENEYLMKNDPSYVRTLENLPEDRKRAMLYGDWDVFEGQYFPEFNRNVHVCEPFSITDDMTRYIVFDYGLDMFACLFVAENRDKDLYIYNEIYKSDLIISKAALEIKNVSEWNKAKVILAPPDLWNKRQETGKSAAEIFHENGVNLTKCNADRINGWLAVKEYLKVEEHYDEQSGKNILKSKLHIFNNCINLIRCLPAIQHDEKITNDCAKEPHEITHITDALRYICSFNKLKEYQTTTSKLSTNNPYYFGELESNYVVFDDLGEFTPV